MIRAPCRSKKGQPSQIKYTKFGDVVTADHIILRDSEEYSRHGDTCILVLQDRHSMWIEAIAANGNTQEESRRIMRKLIPKERVSLFYSDNAQELTNAAEELDWLNTTSTPKRSETNGVGERANRRINEGLRACSIQSGLGQEWFAELATCFTCLRNFGDTIAEQNHKTPYFLPTVWRCCRCQQ